MNINNICQIFDMQLINQDLPICSEPFLELAGSRKGEKFLIKKIKELKKKKIIATYNAKINQEKVGYSNNAMAVWKVNTAKADKFAKIMIKYREISHCYLRKGRKEFPYNLYTMVHAKTKKELDKIINGIAKKIGINDYVVLRSVKELKKSKQEI